MASFETTDDEWAKANLKPWEFEVAVARLTEARREAAQEVADWEARFKLFWAAQQRGVDAWRAAHPGSELTLPDMAHLTTWLLEERERQYDLGFTDAAGDLQMTRILAAFLLLALTGCAFDTCAIHLDNPPAECMRNG